MLLLSFSLFMALVNALYDYTGRGGLCVDAFEGHTCGINRRNDHVECWGTELAAEAYTNYDAPFSQISCGHKYVCGIRAEEKPKYQHSRYYPDEKEGELVCWGVDKKSQGRFEGSFNSMHYTQVSAGLSKVCAINSIGEIECSDLSRYNYDPKPWPEGKYEEITVGVDFACALTATSRNIKCWGVNDEGQTTVPADLTSSAFKMISAGYLHVCGILADTGKVRCWGQDEGAIIPEHLKNKKFSSITCSHEYNCGVEAETSKVFCWGGEDFEEGQMGSEPTDVTFHEVSIGNTHSCGIRTTDGHIQCWAEDHDMDEAEKEMLQPKPDIPYGYVKVVAETNVAVTPAVETAQNSSSFLPAAMFLAGFVFMFALNRLCQPRKESSLELSFLE